MHPVQRRHTYTNAVIAVYILQFFSISKVTIRWCLGIEETITLASDRHWMKLCRMQVSLFPFRN